MAIIVICLVLFLMFWILNYFYKKTRYYSNITIFLKDFKNKKNVDVLNLGSTYAKYAFASYNSSHAKGANLALQSQCLFNDKIILSQYINNLSDNGLVIIPVAACLMLYNNVPDKKLFTIILNRKNNPYFNFPYFIQMKFPLLGNPKRVKYIVKDVQIQYDNVYDLKPSYLRKNEYESELQKLVNLWIKMFELKDLRSTNLSPENFRQIEYNKEQLLDIVSLCKRKNKKVIIVTTPFSNVLNKFFSNEFKQKVLYEPIISVCEETNIPFFDYQNDENFIFSPELFVDGGFCLNKRGSKIFIEKVLNDVDNTGLLGEK